MIPREILISEQQIQARVAEMAAEIRRDFPDEVHLVAVLKGAFIFLSDLVRHPRQGVVDFMSTSICQGHHDVR
jgi:hypoxanthine phosphoribosyltransferase